MFATVFFKIFNYATSEKCSKKKMGLKYHKETFGMFQLEFEGYIFMFPKDR